MLVLLTKRACSVHKSIQPLKDKPTNKMRIEIKLYNTTTGERIFQATAPDIDSAIAELGSMERAMKSYECLWCHEPTQEHQWCGEDCAISYHEDLLLNNKE